MKIENRRIKQITLIKEVGKYYKGNTFLRYNKYNWFIIADTSGEVIELQDFTDLEIEYQKNKRIDGDYTREISFWKRLKVFVTNIQTSCCMGEEEKEMILHNSTLKIKELE